MIRTRSVRKVLSNYCSSSIKPPGHTLLLASTGGNFELGWPDPTRRAIPFMSYCGPWVDLEVVFLSGKGWGASWLAEVLLIGVKASGGPHGEVC